VVVEVVVVAVEATTADAPPPPTTDAAVTPGPDHDHTLHVATRRARSGLHHAYPPPNCKWTRP